MLALSGLTANRAANVVAIQNSDMYALALVDAKHLPDAGLR